MKAAVVLLTVPTLPLSAPALGASLHLAIDPATGGPWKFTAKGMTLGDIADDGMNPPLVEAANEQKFRAGSKRIHDERLRRAKAAGEGRQR